MISTGKPLGQIQTEKDFGPAYLLLVEYRHTTKGGGGTLIAIKGSDAASPKQFQIQGNFADVGDVINQGGLKWNLEQARAGRPDRMTRFGPNTEKPLGEWNVIEIIADLGNIIVTLNGHLQNVATGIEDLTGKIGLQSEGAVMEFRRVEVRPILKP